jgi:dienelactone hydrolase
VLTGAADPWVPAEAVEAFRRDMAAVGDRVRIVSYPNARHAFTNPAADSHGMEQLAYDAAADSASWQAMKGMFGEVWK